MTSQAENISQTGDRCVILGGGGHARVLIDSLHARHSELRLVILEHDRSRLGQKVSGVEIVGDDSDLANLATAGAKWFLVGVGTVKSSRIRQRLFQDAIACQLRPLEVIHPRAIVSHECQIGPGVQLLPGCIVNAGACIGENVIVNTGAIIEHDCFVGNHVHIATGSRLAGAVHIGDGAFIGIGATIRQGIRIGDEAVVGAGAVVIHDVPAGITVVGVPASPTVSSLASGRLGRNRPPLP